MAFLIHSTGDNRVPQNHRMFAMPGTTPEVGMAMELTSGKLAPVGAGHTPAYISMTERENSCNNGDMIYAIRAESDIVFETQFNAPAASIAVGDKVTVSADSKYVTATTTDGVAEVVHIFGTDAGSKVLVRFP